MGDYRRRKTVIRGDWAASLNAQLVEEIDPVVVAFSFADLPESVP
jgi:hypothetical protein